MADVGALISDLIAAGLDGNLVGRVAAALAEREAVLVPDESAERRRAADRERKRLRKSAEVGGIRGTEVSPKETPPTPPKEITPSDIPPATPKGVSAPKPTPRSELVSVLSPLQADAVIAHRQRIGKPMTAHAAHLLAAKFAQCKNPDAAADAMVANGWQGFEPAWLERGGNQRAGPGRQSPIDHFRNYATEITDGQIRDDRGPSGDWDDASGVPIRAIEHHG